MNRRAKAGWSRAFDEPIPLPDGRKIVTLRDAGDYITKLPKADHTAPEWQAAMEALILVADLGRPDDVCPDRRHARGEPVSGAGVQSGPQRPSLGKAEAQAG